MRTWAGSVAAITALYAAMQVFLLLQIKTSNFSRDFSFKLKSADWRSVSEPLHDSVQAGGAASAAEWSRLRNETIASGA